MYKYAHWHLTCHLQWAIFFSIKLKKCQGRQGEGTSAGSDAAVCTLWAHFSSAGIHLTDAFGCQQLNKPRFEGRVLYIWSELSKVCQCLWESGLMVSHTELLVELHSLVILQMMALDSLQQELRPGGCDITACWSNTTGYLNESGFSLLVVKQTIVTKNIIFDNRNNMFILYIKDKCYLISAELVLNEWFRLN